jgi:hypothetical protein
VELSSSTSRELAALSEHAMATLTYARQVVETAERVSDTCEGARQESGQLGERLLAVENRLDELSRAAGASAQRLERRGREIAQLQRETLADVKGIPPMVGDVLRLAAGPEGAIQRWLLRQDYVVTEAALSMVKRGLPDPTTGDGLVVAMALGKMLSGDREPKSASSFKKAFEEKLPPNPPPSLKQLLEQTMPLIYWACRVPD